MQQFAMLRDKPNNKLVKQAVSKRRVKVMASLLISQSVDSFLRSFLETPRMLFGAQHPAARNTFGRPGKKTDGAAAQSLPRHPVLSKAPNYTVYGLGSEMYNRVTGEGQLNVRKNDGVPPDDIYLQGRGWPKWRREVSIRRNRDRTGHPKTVRKWGDCAIDQRDVVGVRAALRRNVQVAATV
jgi:hypothetical protein